MLNDKNCNLDEWEEFVKTTFYVFFIIIFSACLIYFSGNMQNNKVLAASGSSTSDVQLIARAINRRSKRREL